MKKTAKFLLTSALVLGGVFTPVNSNNSLNQKFVSPNISKTNFENSLKKNNPKLLIPFLANMDNTDGVNIGDFIISYSFENATADTLFIDDQEVITFHNSIGEIIVKYDNYDLVSLTVDRDDGSKDYFEINNNIFGNFTANRDSKFIHRDSKGNILATEYFKGNYTLKSDIDSDSLKFDLNFGESKVNFNKYTSDLAISDYILKDIVIPNDLLPNDFQKTLESLETTVSKSNDNYKFNSTLSANAVENYFETETTLVQTPNNSKKYTKRVPKNKIHNLLVNYTIDYDGSKTKSIFLDDNQIFSDVQKRMSPIYNPSNTSSLFKRTVSIDTDLDGIYDVIKQSKEFYTN